MDTALINPIQPSPSCPHVIDGESETQKEHAIYQVTFPVKDRWISPRAQEGDTVEKGGMGKVYRCCRVPIESEAPQDGKLPVARDTGSFTNKRSQTRQEL